jgi:hypothetical protein
MVAAFRSGDAPAAVEAAHGTEGTVGDLLKELQKLVL